MPIEVAVVQQAMSSVAADLVKGLEGAFTPAPNSPVTIELNGSNLEPMAVTAQAETLVAVPWRFPCTHTGDFLGVPATYIDLELRGATFVEVNGPDAASWTYYRFIDFLSALHQIGVSTDGRPALTADEYANWRERSSR
jgi:aminoglycoside phosphotransferase (APT) family kinase protein